MNIVPWHDVADDGEGVDALECEEGEDDGEEEVKADTDVAASVLRRKIRMQEFHFVLNCHSRIFKTFFSTKKCIFICFMLLSMATA